MTEVEHLRMLLAIYACNDAYPLVEYIRDELIRTDLSYSFLITTATCNLYYVYFFQYPCIFADLIEACKLSFAPNSSRKIRMIYVKK